MAMRAKPHRKQCISCLFAAIEQGKAFSKGFLYGQVGVSLKQTWSFNHLSLEGLPLIHAVI
jgi:hypothetical protein